MVSVVVIEEKADGSVIQVIPKNPQKKPHKMPVGSGLDDDIRHD